MRVAPALVYTRTRGLRIKNTGAVEPSNRPAAPAWREASAHALLSVPPEPKSTGKSLPVSGVGLGRLEFCRDLRHHPGKRSSWRT